MFLVAKENTTNTLFVYFSIKTVTMDISDIYQNIFAETFVIAQDFNWTSMASSWQIKAFVR